VDQQQRDDLAGAEERLAQHEARVARQEQIIVEMDRDNHPKAAAVGRTVLATLQKSLALCRGHVEALRGGRLL
jgi:uncharacterized coiled-coil protein SlyX